MQTQINIRTLKAIALAACTESTRYYLNGVLVECRADSVTYVATDGHVMLCAREALPELTEGEPPRLVGDWIIPLNAIKALKVRGNPAPALETVPMTKHGESKLLLGEIVVTPVDGTFPDWRRVLPGKVEGIGACGTSNKTYDGVPAQFDARYLGILGDFVSAMTGERRELYAHIHHTESTSPHAITFGTQIPDAFGVLMPMRHSEAPWKGAPAWISQPAPEAL